MQLNKSVSPRYRLYTLLPAFEPRSGTFFSSGSRTIPMCEGARRAAGQPVHAPRRSACSAWQATRYAACCWHDRLARMHGCVLVASCGEEIEMSGVWFVR